MNYLVRNSWVWRICLMLNLVFVGFCAYSQQVPAFLNEYNATWVDSVFNQLTLDQKIGQLLMPRGNYSGRPHDVKQLKEWVSKYKIGGIVFFASNPTAQARLTNELQALSDVPLFIGQDLEWGLGMRLDSTHRFPYNMTIGAAPIDTETLTRMGQEIGRQCKRMGIHINYAPVVDVNNNPKNPVINFRSFGGDKEVVTQNGLALMQGMQSQHILCTAKHFPGHGDTAVDSHYDLPVISHSRDRLDDVELYPFKALIRNGLSGVMTAHLNIPALEAKPGLASTFSYNIVFRLLREEMQFQGLTFTDAMEMEGAVKNYPKGESMVRALLAGNDILETFIEVPLAVEAIKKAISENRISMVAINAKVKKILKAKSWVGLDTYQPIALNHLVQDLNTIESDVVNHILTQNSITCLKNDLNLLPIKDVTQKIAVLSIGKAQSSDFFDMVENYAKADFFSLEHNAEDSQIEQVFQLLKDYDLILATGHFTDIRTAKKYGLTVQNTKILSRLATMDQVVLSLLGSPFILGSIPELAQSKTLLLAYQQSEYTESITPQMIFGALPTLGRLPLTLNNTFYQGMGLHLKPIDRLIYTIPELAGMDRKKLHTAMDSIIYAGLEVGAFPGCVLEVAVDGKVIFNKPYGYHTFEQSLAHDAEQTASIKDHTYIDDAMDNDMKNYTRPEHAQASSISQAKNGQVRTSDIYDLASLTKIIASAPILMTLVSDGQVDIQKRLETYIPSIKNTPIGSVIFKDALTHRAGLKAWIPFWKDAIDTSATLKKAFTLHPEWKDLAVFQVKKPGFIKRIFGKKPQIILDTIASAHQPELWRLALNETSKTWKKGIFSTRPSTTYSIPVSKDMYMNPAYTATIMQAIKNEPLQTPGKYVYSDLHYYFYPEMVQHLTGQSMENRLQQLYASMGCYNLTYNPWQSSALDRVIPTEYDSLFRHQLIHGYVHDEGAALMGGISGHAGLFGNANDVTKMMQLYLQQGNYGSKSYFKPEVIQQFTSYQYPDEHNRRGLVFDKRDLATATRNIPTMTSSSAFGHSGFTGTYAWADPEYKLTYVFLSNRVYPTRYNTKLIDMNIRAAIGDVLIQQIRENKRN